MKNYLKYVLAMALIVVSVVSYAQKIGIRAGVNMSNMSYTEEGEAFFDELKISPNLHVGLVAEMPFSKMLAVETGLVISSKGFRLNENYSEDGYDVKFSGRMTVFNAEVPINIKAYMPINSDLNAYIMGGPYLGAGIFGNSKYKYSFGDESDSETEKLVFGTDEDSDLRRLDYGVNIGAGVTRDKLQAGVFYSLGLANISPTGGSDNKISNRVFGVSLLYFIK